MKRKNIKKDSDNLKAFLLVSYLIACVLGAIKLFDSDPDQDRKKRNLERIKVIYEQLKQIEK